MKEDISQLGDYDASFCEQQYMHGSCYISLFKFKSFNQFNTPQLASNFRHLLSCGTIDRLTSALGVASKATGGNTVLHNCNNNVGKETKHKATNTEVKYDENIHFVSGDFVDTDGNKQSLKGRLKHSIEFWKNTLKTNDFVIEFETVNDGYKLPLKETPIDLSRVA